MNDSGHLPAETRRPIETLDRSRLELMLRRAIDENDLTALRELRQIAEDLNYRTLLSNSDDDELSEALAD